MTLEEAIKETKEYNPDYNPEPYIMRGLRILAGLCDGAVEKDGAGFNKSDTVFGTSLAGRRYLTPRQLWIAAKVLRKYHRQLPNDVMAHVRGVCLTEEPK